MNRAMIIRRGRATAVLFDAMAVRFAHTSSVRKRRKALACLPLLLMPSMASALVGPAREAPEFEPYVVMVLDRDGGSASYCSGSVIAQNIILTAAHCVSSIDDTRVHFREAQGRPVLLEISAIAINPGFRADAARRRLLSIDLALVRLAEPLPARFAPVELSRSDKVELGQKFRIAGFGISEEGAGRTGGILRAGLVVANGPKSSVLLWVRDPDGTGLGACTGDSGAPIFAVERPAVVAVAVWAKGENGQQCGALTQAVLIEPQRAWIDRVLQAWDGSQTTRP